MKPFFYSLLGVILLLVSCETKTKQEEETHQIMHQVQVISVESNEVSIQAKGFSIDPLNIELSKDQKKWSKLDVSQFIKDNEMKYTIKGLEPNTPYFARVKYQYDYVKFNFVTKETKVVNPNNLFTGKYKGIFNAMWHNTVTLKRFHKDSVMITQPLIKGSQIVIFGIKSEEKPEMITFKAKITLKENSTTDYAMEIPLQYIKNINDTVKGQNFFSMTHGSFSTEKLDYCIYYKKRKYSNSFTAGEILK